MSSDNSITSITGVYAGGIAAGIKPSAKDLAFIFVPQACACAGVFTQSTFSASCVAYSRSCIEASELKAIIINSGNANAATGSKGEADCLEMAELAASKLGLRPEEVAVASTGIIGKNLPMDVVRLGISTLLENPKIREGSLAAEAIMTTDLVTKEVLVRTSIAGVELSIGGIAKGSGMIAPNMATMLGFLVTDANISQEALGPIFKRAINRSFNMISVDTDTSTNDMVLCIANGQTGPALEDSQSLDDFEEALTETCIELAKKIVRDGEGATKLIEVQITGASCEKDAHALALSVINSPLVKTAIHGEDPNWGRVIMALGKTPDVEMDPNRVSVSFQKVVVFSEGQPQQFERSALKSDLACADIVIRADLGLGTAAACAWGCDLTKEYIDINVDYN